jgi:hypothetical protein
MTANSAIADWHRIWVSIRQHGWTSLALLPTHGGLNVLRLAETLAATGRLQGQRPVTVIDGTGARLEAVGRLLESIDDAVERGAWVVVPVDALADNPTSIAIVQGTSAVLLIVRLGESSLGTARDILETVGRDRFLGSVVLDEASGAILEQ